jgi:hypothetical protein
VTDDVVNDDSEYADDIFGTDVYEAPAPQRKAFLPWHRPRKQYVRHFQWHAQIEKLLDEFPRDGDTLKYFGLPGIDLLDLRCIHSSICEPRKLHLRFLGFNSDAKPASNEQVELHLSLDEVRRLSLVDPGSDIIGDDFCLIADENSIAWKRSHELGPYDIVNLDLCDGFAKHPPGKIASTHYNALGRLLTLQARYKNPWLLLLTTRAGRDHVNSVVLRKMLIKYLQNLAQCAEFKTESESSCKIADRDALMTAAKTSSGLLQLFLVGLCKWIVGLAVNQDQQSKVEVVSVIGYRVYRRAEQEDLISLAFRFEPVFSSIRDPLGLTKLALQRVSECELAVNALRSVNRRENADAILLADPELKNQMIEAMEKLLEVARYDVPAYRDWLTENQI